MKAALRVVAARLAWRRASLRRPWRRDGMPLVEHFVLTAFCALGFCLPYFW